jgi:hypothetical protein
MFCAVLVRNILATAVIGNKLVLHRFARALPWLERVSGGVLILLALVVILSLVSKATTSFHWCALVNQMNFAGSWQAPALL